MGAVIERELTTEAARQLVAMGTEVAATVLAPRAAIVEPAGEAKRITSSNMIFAAGAPMHLLDSSMSMLRP